MLPTGWISQPTLRTIIALMLREMSTTYGRSVGGYFWAIAEPVASITFLTLVFSLAFRAPPLGTDFAIFYASGLMPFLAYRDTAQKTSTAIYFSKSLLSYPSVMFLDAILARFFLTIVTNVMVFIITLIGIMVLFQPHVLLDLKWIVIAMVLAFQLGIGVGVLNCFLFAYAPAWERIWNVLNRPMFILSCVLFTFETVPAVFQKFLWFNPLIHIVGIMRRGFYPTYDAPYVSIAYVAGFGMISLVLGLFLLRRWTQNILSS